MSPASINYPRLALIIAAIVFSLLLLGIGVWLLARSPAPAAGDDYVIKASVSKDCTGTPWFVGEEKGFFSSGGVLYRDVGETAADQRPMALAMGQIDVLDVDPLTLVHMVRSGIKVTAVAQSGDAAADGDTLKEYLHWIVIDDSSSYDSFAAIAAGTGTVRIGVSAVGTSADLQTDALLRKYGISRDRAQYVVLADRYQEQALRQGLIDVATLHSAYFACANTRRDVRAIAVSSDVFGPAGGTTLLIARQDTIDRYPEALAKFIAAYKASQRWCNENRAEAGKITAARLGICTGAAHYYSASGQINETQLQFWIDQMVADGGLPPGAIRAEDLYTGQFNSSW